jgi:hypothetical protein
MRFSVPFLPRSLWLGLGLVLVSICVLLVLFPSNVGPANQVEMAMEIDAVQVEIDPETERKIISFCSACHAMPAAESFARDAWHAEVMQGYHFYAKSGRTDLDAPAPYLTIAYFRSKAAVVVELPAQVDASSPCPMTFRAEHYPVDQNSRVPTGIANLKWLPPVNDKSGILISSDMRLGTVNGIDLKTKQVVGKGNERIGHPCHAEACDLNQDGYSDLIVADLGSFEPDDHDRGRVVWMRGDAAGNWTAHPVAEKLGRISDVRPVDLDQDGDLDLVVAEFGWHTTGGIHVLRNRTENRELPTFERERIHSRSGTIHVPCQDIDGDGLPDIVALVSQEHERVELLLNRGAKPWEIQTLWAAPDPAFGMSGLALVDFDRDGDLDVLFTNGDTFDSMSLKPSHGIQWLRNDGKLRFVYQRIADLSGVYRALAADFDRDGDLDLIACVWMPGLQHTDEWSSANRAALVLFEQVTPQKFNRYTLVTGEPCFATLETGDYDGDGDQDIAVGCHSAHVGQSDDKFMVWWNETKPGAVAHGNQ